MPETTGPADDDLSPKNNPSLGQRDIADLGRSDDQSITNPVSPVPSSSGPNSLVNQDANDYPGKRLKNPLGDYPTYTYQISLYMITPDAYDAFIKTGRKNIQALNNLSSDGSGGALLIAQSGGINENSNRASSFELDYYIDNLKISTTTSGKDSLSESNTTNITFTITEPYGFSFISNLKRAADSLQEYSQRLGYKNLSNPTRQFFILGIRFLGLDIDGKPITGKNTTSGSGTITGKASNNGSNGIYERFYDILITKLQFKLDGKATVYSVKASPIAPQVSLGTLKGVINNRISIEADTVENALTQLMGALNKQQEELSKTSSSIPNKYTFNFIGDSLGISSARMVSPTDVDKWRYGGSGAKTTSQVNDATGATASPAESSQVKTLVFENGTPIVQAINTIISRSTYLENALKTLFKTYKEPDPTDPAKSEIEKDTKVYVSWYHLSPEVTDAKYDETVKDFAWQINYVIEPYQTPVVQNAYTNSGVPYYGPHKRYEYYFTGKNTEVISYEQNLDNTFFNVALINTESDNSAGGGGADIPVQQGALQPVPSTAALNVGSQAQNAYLTDLFTPTAYAMAKLKILGDPDFLVPESTTSVEDVYNEFYGVDGFTINANGGQVFIEVDFKEAEDYNFKRNNLGKYSATNNGLMSINESIQFWKYPKKLQNIIKGVSYMVTKVESEMSGGIFTQTLNCNINTFPGITDEKADDTGRSAATTVPGSSITQSRQQPSDEKPPVGLRQDRPVVALPGDISGQQKLIPVGTNGDDDNVQPKFSLDQQIAAINKQREYTLSLGRGDPNELNRVFDRQIEQLKNQYAGGGR
jgi:hypothetical protein